MQIKAKQHLSGGGSLQTEVKIGIHYGKVIAGVIGAHKPQFSLIGDTVNTASRVCSSCKKGRITLSKEAHQRLGKTDWLFIEREVEAKGKGILHIYSLAENIRSTIIKGSKQNPSTPPSYTTPATVNNSEVYGANLLYQQ